MITIKDEALGKFYLEHDYHGFRLKDSESKNPTAETLSKKPDINGILQEAAKYLVADLEGTYTLAGFQAKVQEIHEGLQRAFSIPVASPTQELESVRQD